MNEIEKIGMYSTDEILEFMTKGEGRGFLGRSMFDAMYFEIKNLQSKIDTAIEYIKIQQKVFKDYDIVIKNQLNNLLDILREVENVENN